MRKLLMTVALVALVASPAAIAQTGSRSSGANSSLDKGGGPWPAPVGHRQPRADQVPSERDLSDPNTAVNREDAALDRSIKSICRGC
jgi:hypothetical protein